MATEKGPFELVIRMGLERYRSDCHDRDTRSGCAGSGSRAALASSTQRGEQTGAPACGIGTIHAGHGEELTISRQVPASGPSRARRTATLSLWCMAGRRSRCSRMEEVAGKRQLEAGGGRSARCTGKTVVVLKLTTADEDAVLGATDEFLRLRGNGSRVFPDGKVVAVGTSIGQVKLYDARTGGLLRLLDDHAGKLADKETPENWTVLERAMGSVASLEFSPDGSMLATCGGSFGDFSRVFLELQNGWMSGARVRAG